jgi:hypothetical protein
VFKVFSSSRWYYILTLGFIVNIMIIVILLVYIYRRRSNSKGGIYRPGAVYDRVITPGGKGYRPVSPAEKKAVGLKPFHDDMSSDEDTGKGFLTPYSDNPAGKPFSDE